MPSWAAVEWLKRATYCIYVTMFAYGGATDNSEDKPMQVTKDPAPRPDMMLASDSVWTYVSNECASKGSFKVRHEDKSITTAQQQQAKSSAAESKTPCTGPAVAAIAALVEAATPTPIKNSFSAVSRTVSSSSLQLVGVPLLASADTLSPAVAAIAASVKAAEATKNRSRAASRTDSTATMDVTEVLPLLARNKLSPAVAAIAALIAAPGTPTQARSRAVSRTDSTCSVEVTETPPPGTWDTLLPAAATLAAPADVVGPATPAVLAADVAVAVQAVSSAVGLNKPVQAAAYALPEAAPAASAAVPSPAAPAAAPTAAPAAAPAASAAVPAAPAAPAAVLAAPVQPSMAPDPATSTSSTSSSRDVILSYGIASSQNTPAYQEDRAVAAMLHSSKGALSQGERFAVAAVFDGHAGAAAAEHLQQHMVSTLQEKLQQNSKNPAAALAAAVADLEVQLMAAQCSSGSTLSAVLVLGDTLYVANVGDSRAVLCRNGKAEPLTADHKASSQQETARILAADPFADISADGYCYGLGVSRDLGSYELKVDGNSKGLTAVPEISTQQLQHNDDFVLIASDGLFDKVSNSDAISTVRRALAAGPGDCTAAAQAAVDRAIALKSDDNITAVVLLLHSRPIQLPKSNSRLFRNRSVSSSSSGSGASSSDNSRCSISGGTCSGTAGDSSTRCQ